MEKKKRRRFMQRVAAAVLAVCLAGGMVLFTEPLEAKAMTRNEFDSKLSSIESRFPSGSQYKDELYSRGMQCFGYAHWVANQVFGLTVWNANDSFNWGKVYNMNNVKAGDIIQYGNPSNGTGHTIFVTAVSGNTITYTDANVPAGTNKVRWRQTIQKNAAFGSKSFNYLQSGPEVSEGNNPIGSFDGIAGGTNTVSVSGWAFDPDVPWQSIEIHVYIGGPAGVGEGHSGIIANTCREDVNNVYGTGVYHGFGATIRTSLSGTQTVYVYAINVGGGTGNPLIGTKTVTISKDTTGPTISDVQVVDMDATGYTVTCRVEDADGVARVQFPTWTALNGQDDLAGGWWDNPSCRGTQDGTTWRFRVNDKDHDFERGIYHTHIYAWDNNGNSTGYGLNGIEFQNTYSYVNAASYNGHTYHLYNDILTWEEAKEKCEELGGHLVTITSEDEQETIEGLIQGQARLGYWIGGSSGNGSTWVTGEEFSFSNWSPGEPNADGGEDSYEIYPDGTWNDLMGSSKYLGFICEWEKLPHTHDYKESAWKSDAESHWQECECGEKSEEAAHGFTWIIDALATEENEGIKHEECGTCGYMRNIGTAIEKLSSTHTHDYGTAAWKADAESHWKECECGEKAENAAHQFSGVIDRAATEDSVGIKHEECETCGYKRNVGTVIEKFPPTHTHDYEKSTWKFYVETHWKECECGEKSEEAAHGFAWIIDTAATENSTGIKHEECGTCGYKRNIGTIIEKISEDHTHDYGASAWKTDAESHWKECECGEKAENAAHQFSWVIDIAATEDSTGLKHEECETCGYERSMGTIIEKLNAVCAHAYKTIITPATTQANGSIVETCSKCGDEKSKSIIYAAGNASLSKTSYVYNGKTQKPSVTVKDSRGKALKNNVDYTVSFPKGMKNVGRYIVTVTLKGNYSGAIAETFDIVPKGTSISKVTAKKKGFAVKWKKQKKQTTGYEIAYSTSSKFAKKSTKIINAGKSGATSKTVLKLKVKKKYYVRIRTYKTVKINGKSVKLCSDWSKAKAVTTKK